MLGGGERGWGGDWTCMKNEPQQHAHRDSNPRSMAWETSAFPIYYYPMWLYTRIHNHQAWRSPVVSWCPPFSHRSHDSD